MLDTLAKEFSHEAPVALEVLLVRLIGAALLCGLIGLERELSNNSAGLRTNMLIGLAAAVFTLVGLQVMHEFGNQPDTVRSIPSASSRRSPPASHFSPQASSSRCVVM